MLNEKEEPIGMIYTGTIYKVIETSAVLCFRLSSISDDNGKRYIERAPYSIDNIHSRVLSVSKELYLDGHYRAAILDAYIDLVDRVKQLSNEPDLDGTNLMQKAFSRNNPKIKISDDTDEQLGFMWLFSGAVMAIRNPKAHKITTITDPHRALEWLSYASVLHRVLDDFESSI